MNKSKSSTDSEDIILRQVTDHLYQCFRRIEDNIEYLVFLRMNNKIQELANGFYMKQIDRFSRDTIITFGHILNKDRRENTLHSLILCIKDKKLRNKMELRLDKLRKDTKLIISHRNKVIAHHEIKYNSQLGDWYPTQPFNYAYILNPCLCKRVSDKAEKLFWRLKSILNIEGVGMFMITGGNYVDLFKKKTLGERSGCKKDTMVLVHNCRYKNCLLKQ